MEVINIISIIILILCLRLRIKTVIKAYKNLEVIKEDNERNREIIKILEDKIKRKEAK